MNLPMEIHRLTGRMRKARRRMAPHLLRSAIGYFAYAGAFVSSVALEPHHIAQALCCVLAMVAWSFASRADRRARLYQRVVDRCQGAILTILALQGPAIPVERPSGDRMRWS